MTIIASDKRLQIKEESSFDQRNIDFSSGATFIPLLNDGFGVFPRKTTQNINSNLGHPHPRRVVMERNNTGPLTAELNKDTRQILMELGFGGLSGGVPSRNKSYAFRLQKGSVSGQLVTGAKCNTMTVSANRGGIVELTAEIIAAHEEKIAAPSIALPSTLLTPYRFATALAVLNGAAATSVESFTLNVNHNLAVGPHRTSSLEISYLEYGELDVTGSATFLFEAETYNDLVRGTATGTVYLLLGSAYATHNGTAWNTDDYFEASAPVVTYSGGTLALDSVASVGPLALGSLVGGNGDQAVQHPILIKLNAVEIPEAPENLGDGRIVMQTLNFEITAPSDTSVKPLEVFIDAVAAA